MVAYGLKTPIGCSTTTKFQVVLKPNPGDIRTLYPGFADITSAWTPRCMTWLCRDNCGNSRPSALGLGWESLAVTGYGIVTSSTYFQQSGVECYPVPAKSPTASSVWRCTCKGVRFGYDLVVLRRPVRQGYLRPMCFHQNGGRAMRPNNFETRPMSNKQLELFSTSTKAQPTG